MIWKAILPFRRSFAKISDIKRLLVNTVAVFFAFATFSQGVDFSQPFTNLLYTNPAFAGTNVCPRAYLNHRQKSYGYGRPYTAYLASYDQSIRRWSLEVGAVVLRDENNAGRYNSTSFSPILGKEILVNKKTAVRLALMPDIIYSQLSAGGNTYPDMIDPIYGFAYATGESITDESRLIVGASAGAVVYADAYFFGAAVHNVSRPNAQFSSKHTHYPRKLSVHVGYVFSVDDGFSAELKLMPAMYVQHESRQLQAMLGVTAELGFLYVGIYGESVSSVLCETLTPVIGIHQKRFKFAYTCDFHVVGLRKNETDTHEVSLALYLNCTNYTQKQRSIKCPTL